MSLFEMREAIESRIPVWVLFVPLVGAVVAHLITKETTTP